LDLWPIQRRVIDTLIERTASPLSSGNAVEFLHDSRIVFDRMQQRAGESSGWLGLFAYEWDNGPHAQRFAQLLSDAAATRHVLVGMDGYGSRGNTLARPIAASGGDVFIRRPRLQPWNNRPPQFGRPLFHERRSPTHAPRIGQLRGSSIIGASDCCWGAHSKLFIASDSSTVGEVGEHAVAIVAGNQIRERWNEQLPNGELLVADHGAELRGPVVKLLAAEMLRCTELARRVNQTGYEKHPTLESKYTAQLRSVLQTITNDFAWQAPKQPAPGMMQIIASEPLADRQQATAIYDATDILYEHARGGKITLVSSVMNLPQTRLDTFCRLARDTDITMVLNRVDEWAIRFAAVRQYETLLRAGVKLFEMNGDRQLHAKLSLYENKQGAFAVQSGSSNANIRSLIEDKETDWISYDTGVIGEGKALADWYIAQSDPVSLDEVEAMIREVTPQSLWGRSKNLIYQRFI
jgi:phosphatidylserine/phosphatidylglycerophosphate/cardiolipin synthase-like enzyme